MDFKSLKIIHINATDCGGGAAIACSRHCEAMIKARCDSRMLVVSKRGHQSFVPYSRWGWRSLLSTYYRVMSIKRVGKLKATGEFSIMRYGCPFYKVQLVKDADVIFLHWVNGNALSIDGVEDILKLNKPTFWYMHDMFPITGGCHHSLSCEGYTKDCSDCPLINNQSLKSKARKQLRQKIKHWSKYSNLEFIAPSEWLGRCIKNSILSLGHKVHIVPNVIDTTIYKPLDIDAKRILGLDPQKKTILFGAASMDSIYKGTKYAHDCLMELDPEKYEGVVIGNADKEFMRNLPIKVVETGFLNDNLSLSLVYNACDTFIISSIAENYPNVVLEAMACGKPCVGFRTGGIPDLIHHKKTGYLTEEKTADCLKKGIEWLFEDRARYEELSNNARLQILSNNSYDQVLRIHSELNQYAR